MSTRRPNHVRLTFVVGKGGVGKTTVSAAYAAWIASEEKQRTLLLSTDPAHSIADVLQLSLTSKPKPVPRAQNLHAWQIDASKRFKQFIYEHREAMLEVVEQGTIFTRAEIEPFLDTALPGMAEMASLLALADLIQSTRYQHVVVDTAPFGHTLRLFQMPEQFRKLLVFLETAMRRDETLAAHFGGRLDRPATSFVQEWHNLFTRVLAMLRSQKTEVVLVTSPEPFALEQSVRVRDHLKTLDLRLTRIVLNRVISEASDCARCKRSAAERARAERFLRKHFGTTPVSLGEDHGFPILGIAQLSAFGANIFGDEKKRVRPSLPLKSAAPEFIPIEWPATPPRLSFTLGKGGVGKTTVSAGLAFSARLQKRKVTICSTDPSPSLDEVFEQPVGNEPVEVLGDPNLRALEVDSLAEYRKFADRLRRSLNTSLGADRGGIHVELSHDIAVLDALLDIVPPGVDELLGIMRLAKLLEENPNTHVVIDMAPTGHALELLRMPDRMLQWSRLLMKVLAGHRDLAIAQDIAVEVAALSQDVRRLLEVMRNRQRCAIYVVMLAEPLPDRETRRLQADLRHLKLTPYATFVNRVHFPSARATARCRRCGIAMNWQRATLAELAEQGSAGQIYVVRDFAEEISGKRGLRRLTSELWQLLLAKPVRVRVKRRLLPKK